MRQPAILLFIFLSIGEAITANAKTNTSVLNGTWIPVKQEMGGKELSPEAFEKQKLIINDNTYTFFTGSVDKGEVSYNNGKMDLHGKVGVNSGKHFTAIYKYENGPNGAANGLLTICYNLAGDSYPEEFETKSKPLLFISVFKKVKIK